MAKIPDHLHKYKKVNIGTDGTVYYVYRCMVPTCTHYTPVHLAENKLCACNRCGDPMLFTKVVLNGSSGKAMTKPHCPDCVKPRKDKTKDVAAIAEFLKQ